MRIDTLKAQKRLTGAGAGDQLAEAIIEIVSSAEEETATKGDLKRLEMTFSEEIRQLELKLSEEIRQLELKFSEEMRRQTNRIYGAIAAATSLLAALNFFI